MIEEVAADTGLYRSQNSGYTDIVVFIWDDGRRAEEHDLLARGIGQLPGVVGVVIVSRPGRMQCE